MPSPPPPLWRRLYDTADRAVTPHLESLVRTEHFSRAAATATWAQSVARRQINGVSARLWHLVNLPAGTDVLRLRAQVGALDREVRRLTLQLERERRARAAQEETPDAAGAEPDGSARPRPPRRGAQRPPGP